MAIDRLEQFLSLLQDVKQVSESRWTARCPVHEERTSSVSISVTADIKIIAKCFGCQANGAAIATAVGFPVNDLFPPNIHPRGNGTNGHLPDRWATHEIASWKKHIAHYVYQNEDGSARFVVVKYRFNDMEKKFVQYRADATPDVWLRGLKDNSNGTITRVEECPYRLPEIIEAVRTSKVVYVVEGEKDAETLRARGMIATSNAGGAGHWRKAFAKYFVGAAVVVFPDNDEPGRNHARQVAESLYGKARELRVVELPGLPPKGDVSDWFANGGTVEELWRIVAAVAPWKPSKEEVIAQTAERVNNTDMGNASRLVAMHGEDIRYCEPWKKWLTWDGRRWLRDDHSAILTRAKKTVKGIAREAAEGDGDFRSALKWALESESAARLFNMIRLSQDEIAAVPDQFDRDLWALNVMNGTLDLRTGRLRPHVKSDMATKLVPTKYDPAATCPTWDGFLLQIMNNNERVVNFLRRAVGYTLTGDTSEHAMFLLHGVGRNGKSTFIDTVRLILADYAQTAEFETWAEKKNDTVRNDIADLRGARFVSTIEASSGKRLNEQMIKSVTGGDQLKARFLYAEYFTFTPQLKLWLAANHKPTIRGADAGIWSRIMLVPFDVFLEPHERDKKLKDKLQTEASGILAWAMQGCLEWQRDGLNPPPEVLHATAAYREEMDSLSAFFFDRCAVHKPFMAMSTDLYTQYREWCEENGDDPASQNHFGLRMRERGFVRERVRNQGNRWGYRGIGIVEQLSPADRAFWDLELAKREREDVLDPHTAQTFTDLLTQANERASKPVNGTTSHTPTEVFTV